MAQVRALRAEYGTADLGGEISRPRLSWKIDGDPAWVATAYEIESMSAEGRRQSTGPIEGDVQLYVPWPFPALRSRERVDVRVRLWSGDVSTVWSEPLRIEAGLLHRADWQASLIRGPRGRNPYLRREFTVRPGLASARVYVSAQGVFELRVNGTDPLPDVMAPGWTSYGKRLPYRTVDVTALLREGRNAIGAILGDGWFRGRLAWGKGRTEVYGSELGLVAQLEMRYLDGSVEVVTTDDGWRSGTGGLVASSLYDGETFDARDEPTGWDEPGFDDSSWSAATVEALPSARLSAHWRPPVVVVAERHPERSWTSESGTTLHDFGQIVTGRLRVEVRAPAGTRIRLRHAEVLEDGALGVRPLRTAKATDVYVCAGGDVEVWEPRFTLHGFRYAEVEGEGVVGVVARVCRADIPETGHFACSNPLVTKLHENLAWSLRGNFTHIPTDCAQRDERLGWTGDAQIIAPSAAFLFDAAAFYGYWLEDLALDQRPSGTVPMVVPSVPLDPFPGDYPVTGWGDAAAVIPLVLHERYADAAVLQRQRQSAVRWAQAETRAVLEPGSFRPGFQFGDWLDPTAPPEHPEDGRTAADIVMALYAIRSCDAAASIVDRLGDGAEAERLRGLGGRLREVFRQRYVSDSGFVVSDSQTAYALALAFDALPSGVRASAFQRLTHVIRRDRSALTTGFLGAAVILDVLVDGGDPHLAYSLLLREDVPSWLYPVRMGATTIWERWDSLLPDGTINPGDMTSFSHFALGAVADWLQRRVGGIAAAEPGYRRVLFAPVPGGNLTWAEARLESPYGEVASRWELDGDDFTLVVRVPLGAGGIVRLPDGSADRAIGPGTHHFATRLSTTRPIEARGKDHAW
jgi:alpha-L-rhamnosidase